MTREGLRPIEEIQAEDNVLAENSHTGEVGYKEVVRTFINTCDVLIHVYIDEETIATTPTHPFYVVDKGWVEAERLRVGDYLKLSNGETVKISSIEIEQLKEPVEVYNFEVKGWHTYFVSALGVLVHNMCAATTPSTKTLTDSVGKIANETGYTKKEIKTAIENVKNDGNWRSGTTNRNPNVVVDFKTGDVYPATPDGGQGDIIGNIFDFLQ